MVHDNAHIRLSVPFTEPGAKWRYLMACGQGAKMRGHTGLNSNCWISKQYCTLSDVGIVATMSQLTVSLKSSNWSWWSILMKREVNYAVWNLSFPNAICNRSTQSTAKCSKSTHQIVPVQEEDNCNNSHCLNLKLQSKTESNGPRTVQNYWDSS